MPVAVSYPGVYIEEIPSGVRTITGVATSITAFIGRTSRGPTNEPVTVTSFGDFERMLGGLQVNYPMSYAVRDFFLNGGSQALIVRILHPNFATNDERDKALDAAKAALTAAKAALTAAKAVADATAASTDVDHAKADAQQASTKIQDNKKSTSSEKAAAKAVADAVTAAAEKAGANLNDVHKAATDAVAPFKIKADAAAVAAIQAIPSKALIKLPTSTNTVFLELEAVSEGSWGNALRARVDYDGINENVAARYKPLTKDNLFNLTVRDMNTGVTERFSNVTVRDSPRRVDRVLKNESNLVRVKDSVPASRPKQTDDQTPPLTEEEKKIPPFSEKDTKRSVRVADDDQASDGGSLLDADDITEGAGLQANKRGLYALDKADLFNLLCIPADPRDKDTDKTVYQKAIQYCAQRRAMLIVDSPNDWKDANNITANNNQKLNDLNLSGDAARNAALFFPRVNQADPLRGGQLDVFVPCGIIAGVMARTDTSRGIWKAPAGIDAALNGIQGLEVNLTDNENGLLNPLGINCLRAFPVIGRVVWGARTLRGADQLADEYKYIPVRRLALYLEESLYRGLKWVVFEPNDEPLWAQIRLNVGAFMQNLFRQGAFQGNSPQQAYLVKCDKETTTQNDINLGIVNILVGFAPLKPAEFVILKIQQLAGQIAT